MFWCEVVAGIVKRACAVDTTIPSDRSATQFFVARIVARTVAERRYGLFRHETRWVTSSSKQNHLIPTVTSGNLVPGDLKSVIRKGVRVQVPPRAPLQKCKSLRTTARRPYTFNALTIEIRIKVRYTYGYLYPDVHKGA